MKRIVFIFLIFLFMQGQSFANNCNFICTKPYDLSIGVSRFMSSITGSNFLAEQVAKSILKNEINKNAEGKFTVKVDSYSLKDLKKGIFKSILINGKNISTNDIYISSLKVATLCDFNYILFEDGKDPIFKEDLPLSFEIEISEQDLNKTMQSTSYIRNISKLNAVGANYGLFRINSTEIKIRENKLYYVLNVMIPFVKNTQNIVIATDLTVVDGDIDFANSKLMNSVFSLDLKKIDKIINYLNPLDFSLNILENKDAVVTVKNVKIIEDRIVINGFFIIPKDED